MKVVVRHRYRSFSVQVREQGTLDDLKRVIASHEEVVPTQVQVVFKRKILMGDPKLQDIGITEGSVIDIVIPMRTFEMTFTHPEEIVLTTLPSMSSNEGPSPATRDAFILQEKIRMIRNMGYHPEQARAALQLANGDVQAAASYLPLDDDKTFLIKTTRSLRGHQNPVSKSLSKSKESEEVKVYGESRKDLTSIEVLDPPSEPTANSPSKLPINTNTEESKAAAQVVIKPETIPKTGKSEQKLMQVKEFLSSRKRLKLITKLVEVADKREAKNIKSNPELVMELVAKRLAEKKALENYTPAQKLAIKKLEKINVPFDKAIELLPNCYWNASMVEQLIEMEKEKPLKDRDPMEIGPVSYTPLTLPTICSV
eukprot:TRINITY_DN11920_c0_g1_i1.p1 TRINITY_DN11920_c0_g1~~TRINITY_DN11920_c0_g1_i1.p1  ORF type:complete len:369 (+),score=47.23 TRINITY_DN11920_c0_g1_i1:81-1187(+)